ncbi:PREDICTED: uncharacterized protein LOC104754403 [Camelina sativa]|uniref:Uncharacterized protein LOC104754403 n=1 Tax=Camelina sativa TaxID=90675 RepID=A0ABM1R876_CAMSA|nr:PREDICTED: uncharacterized protein LOC104754403 [Camelina sativa]
MMKDMKEMKEMKDKQDMKYMKYMEEMKDKQDMEEMKEMKEMKKKRKKMKKMKKMKEIVFDMKEIEMDMKEIEMEVKEMKEMNEIKRATQKQAGAVTWVYWDIKMCPVPDGFHPRLVRPSIKRLLEKNGYGGGPLNVIAYGKLADVPLETLREVFSSGIDLKLLPHGNLSGYIDLSYPANIMVISDPKACPYSTSGLQALGKNPIQPFPYHSLSTLLMKYSGVVGEETAESALWDCLVCARDPPGQSFATFISHLSDEEHHERLVIMHFTFCRHCPNCFLFFKSNTLCYHK